MEKGPGFERGRRPAAEEAAALFEFAGRGCPAESVPVGGGDAIFVAALKRHGVLRGLARLLHDKRMIEEEEGLGRDGTHVALADGGIDVAEVEGLKKLEPLVAE